MAPKVVKDSTISFPSDSDYAALAEKAAREVERYCEDLSSWTDMQLGDDTYKLFSRKNDAIESSEPMILLTTTLSVS